MHDAVFEYIVSRLISDAKDAAVQAEESPNDDFYKGQRLAYYMALDTIKNEILAHGMDAKRYGLDINLDKELLKTPWGRRKIEKDQLTNLRSKYSK